MKVIATNTQDLYPVNLPFEFSIVWKSKRGCDSYWFTPTGKGKIGIDSLNLRFVGFLPDQIDEKIIAMMIKFKTDVLTDGTYYYTRGMSGLVILVDGYKILNSMCVQWRDEGIAQYPTWNYKKEFLEHLGYLNIIQDDNLKEIII